ncbi:hypothetical protein N4P55_01120 [Pseudomonas fluorescens]|uniref:hypothetical protein n=1 Tax=Pseudomonas fluorescens TaxID=294 RepID=UPI0021CF548D|nr:hypothetical protein [Pseudomonas fluorescens]UXV19987.1 hypothetical protein N4P55_01120 [Pseudomonas fluorescens]
MNLFENAIRSIQDGLNDYQYDGRLLSSTRNIYAGILLLFKYKLLLLSGKETNAVLIKQNIVPVLDERGVVVWKGVGNKTIDVSGIKARFKSLDISVDWNIFDRINKHRNEIEHFFSQLTENETAELLADCFIIISRFLSDHLNMDAKTVLGDEAWQILLNGYEVYEHEMENRSRIIDTLIFHHYAIKEIFVKFSCISCSSPLVQPTQSGMDAENSIFCCAECDSLYSYDDICNFGVADLYIGSLWGDFEEIKCPFSNCDICEQGLFLKKYRVCTACGCVDSTG